MGRPPSTTAPFAYDAVPSKFYLEVESVGNLEPDAVVQQAIKVLQQKLAAVIQELEGPHADGGFRAGGAGVMDDARGEEAPE